MSFSAADTARLHRYVLFGCVGEGRIIAGRSSIRNQFRVPILSLLTQHGANGNTALQRAVASVVWDWGERTTATKPTWKTDSRRESSPASCRCISRVPN